MVGHNCGFEQWCRLRYCKGCDAIEQEEGGDGREILCSQSRLVQQYFLEGFCN